MHRHPLLVTFEPGSFEQDSLAGDGIYRPPVEPAAAPEWRPPDKSPSASPSYGSPLGYVPPPTLPPPPVKRLSTGWVVAIVMAAVLVAGTAVGAVLTALTGRAGPITNAAAPATRATSTPTAARATPTASPSPTVISPAATTAGPPPAKSVSDWLHGGGTALIEAMSAHNVAIRDAIKNEDAAALLHACSEYESDAIAGQKYASIPDEEAQQHWAKALPLMFQGAVDCGAASYAISDAKSLMQAVGELNQGTNELNLAVTRLNALHG
jgi:hypothetical protein